MNYSQLFSDCWALGTAYWPLCGLPTWATAFWPGLGGEIISVGHRRFRVLQKLGEGGYAVVLLVVEVASEHQPHPDPEPRALKKVLVMSGDHFDAVQQEMLIHSTVQHHPNILPLLDYCCSEGDTPLPSPAAASWGPTLPTGSPQTSPGHPGAHHLAAAAPPLGDVGLGSGGAGGGGGGGAGLSGTGGRRSCGGRDMAGAGRLGGPLEGGLSTAVHVGSVSRRGGGGGGDGGCHRVACFVFPAFRDGTLAGELERLRERGEMLPTRAVLAVFAQMAKAAAHIHALGYAHRDIKPLNVLIAVDPAHRQNPPSTTNTPGPQQQQQLRWQAGPGRPAGHPQTGEVDPEAGEALMAGADTAPASGPRYRCVLMDFGSARLRRVEVPTRAQAMQLQEDAEAHCSAPYRAPELFDVPSAASLDLAAADVWGLGASLFHVMYGEPPFQRAMNTAGGSLALAVINGAIGWPRPGAPAYPSELRDLVTAAMAAEPQHRPSAAQLVEMAEALALRPLADPRPQK